MKHIPSKTLLLAVAVFAATSFSSCKNKAKETDTTTTVAPSSIDTNTVQAPPITVAPDETLKTGVQDATKDFPGVTADVKDGEITLTGKITRDKLPALMQSLSTMHAKINNQLTVTK